MNKSLSHIYTTFVGVFLLVQGAGTLACLLIPALNQAFPALLAITQMVPAHSTLHILTAGLAFFALRQGQPWVGRFALGFGGFYFGLGALGLFHIHPAILSMQPFDHPFHLLLGGLGLLAYGVNWMRGLAVAKRA